jgi:hypothetical protein
MRFVLLFLVALCTAVGADDPHVRGVVTDESGGVLPGVTVMATADGRLLATTITDGAGRYVLGPLAAGRVTLTFQLDGFASASQPADIGAADVIANQRLLLAQRSETVEVVGKLPEVKPVTPPPPPPPPPRPRPRPVMWAVPEHDPAAVCGPAKLESKPQSLGTIRARRYAANGLYGAGDELDVEGGTASGLALGEHFVVRRTYRVDWDPRESVGEHTAGLVQIVAAGERTAVAVVIYACDEMLPGDRLAPFRPQLRQPVQPDGQPDYRRPAKILFPDIGQMVGAPRRLMVIDRGTASGLRPGQRLTLFRRRAGFPEPLILGDAVVVAVREESATIRVEHVKDAILEGDLAAIQR